MPRISERPLLFAAVDGRHQKGRAFGVLPDDLRRHVHVIGRTGVGKSVLLEHLAVGAIQRGMGCAVIDPHGDLAARILDLIPRARTNDVVVVDPAATDRSPGLNLLAHATPATRHLVAAGVLAVFRKVFRDNWGPRLEHIFRQTLLALLEVRGSTLLGVLRMLVDEAYRASVIRQVSDPLVALYWTREFPQYPRAFLAEVVAPVQNKVAAVLASPPVRRMLGQRRSSLHLREVLDGGHILIADLSKGRLGEDASALLGAVLVTGIQLAAYARADTPEAARRPFLLIVDEFASFTTESFGELLSEARKYGLALVLAHQYLAQLDDRLRASVLGNAGTTIVFRVGGEDALALSPDFAPEFGAEDLTRMGRHQIALRLAVEGLTTRPFSALTLPPAGTLIGHGAVIRATSAERYGRPAAEVDRVIAEQLPLPPRDLPGDLLPRE